MSGGEEEHQFLSLKGNIAVSLVMACLAAAFAMGSALEPAGGGLPAACFCGLLAGVSSFGWGVYLGREAAAAASDEPASDDD